MIAAVIAWVLTVILVAANSYLGSVLTNTPSNVYVTAVIRDICVVVLACLLLLPRIPSKAAASTKIGSQNPEEKSQDKRTLGARTHSTLAEQEKEMEEV